MHLFFPHSLQHLQSLQQSPLSVQDPSLPQHLHSQWQEKQSHFPLQQSQEQLFFGIEQPIAIATKTTAIHPRKFSVILFMLF